MAAPVDAQECHEIDVEAWGEDAAASVEMLLSRIECYPFGNFVAIDRATGVIVGSVWTVATGGKSFATWREASGDGTYRSVCDTHGELLIGINVSVRPPYLGRKIGEQLVIRAAEVAWNAGKRKAVLGSRIPEYHEWQYVFAPEDYIWLRRSVDRAYFQDTRSGLLHAGPLIDDLRSALTGPRIDPRTWPVTPDVPEDLRVFDGELAFFMDIRVRDRPCRLYHLLPGYFPDPASCDNGVMIGWENEEHP